MPAPATLELIADILVRRIVDELNSEADYITLQAALERAYPFAGLPEGETIWRRASERALSGAYRRSLGQAS